jgi:hypothetical protein
MLTIAPRDEPYDHIRKQMAGDAAEEAVGGEPVLFRPGRVGWGDPHKPVRAEPSRAQ